MSIAQTIIQQLGGAGRLNVMTGAYNFIDRGNGVSFKIKNARANYIKITLNGKDLYDLEVGRVRGNTYKVVYQGDDLYYDMLKPAIEKATGMYLSLFKKGGKMAEGGSVSSDNHAIFDSLKKGDKVHITYQDTIRGKNEKNLIVKNRTRVGVGKKWEADKIALTNVDNPNGVKFFFYKDTKDGYLSYAVGDMGIWDVKMTVKDKFADGGGLDYSKPLVYDRDKYNQLLSEYDKVGAFLDDAETQEERAKLKKKLRELESLIHRYERNYADGGNINNNAEKLIQEIKKHSNYVVGTTSTSKDGKEKYRYDSYYLKYKSATNWLVKLFEKVAEEITGKSYNKNFTYGDYSFFYDRPSFKGESNGTMQMKKLVIIDKNEKENSMAKGGNMETLKGGEQITYIAKAIFDKNKKDGKIKISTKEPQTLGGLKYLIADANAEYIASAIFEANQKNGKIKTTLGDKTYGQLMALISHAKANRLENFSMAKGGKTKKGKKEPMVVRGFFEDEPYEYAKGGKMEDSVVRKGDYWIVKNQGNTDFPFLVNSRDGAIVYKAESKKDATDWIKQRSDEYEDDEITSGFNYSIGGL